MSATLDWAPSSDSDWSAPHWVRSPDPSGLGFRSARRRSAPLTAMCSGKGHEVVFQADTPLQLQLAPGPYTCAMTRRALLVVLR